MLKRKAGCVFPLRLTKLRLKPTRGRVKLKPSARGRHVGVRAASLGKPLRGNWNEVFRGESQKGKKLDTFVKIPVLPSRLVVLGLLFVWGAIAGRAADWEKEIAAFEARDKADPVPRGGILFLGSSSIRLWKSLADDFAGYKVINRGFGGSQIADSTRYLDRIVFPYMPRLIVLYAGDNDIADKKRAEDVLRDFEVFVGKVREKLPETRVAFISIKPSRARWHLVDEIRKANGLLEAQCRKDGRLDFIDIFNPMLGRDGKPDGGLLAADGLHLNEQGYRLWRDLVKPHWGRVD